MKELPFGQDEDDLGVNKALEIDQFCKKFNIVSQVKFSSEWKMDETVKYNYTLFLLDLLLIIDDKFDICISIAFYNAKRTGTKKYYWYSSGERDASSSGDHQTYLLCLEDAIYKILKYENSKKQ